MSEAKVRISFESLQAGLRHMGLWKNIGNIVVRFTLYKAEGLCVFVRVSKANLLSAMI